MAEARYVVGIDLGTTNSAVAFVDSGSADEAKPVVQDAPVLQVVQAGETAARPLLPSFLYLPSGHEFPKKALNVPWASEPKQVVGTFARDHGAAVPRRLISSAKSWLSYAGVDRREAILPWGAAEDVDKLSPVDAAAAYLRHIRDAWNHAAKDGAVAGKLEEQDLLLTVPASFDAVARELTVEAAKAAGLARLTLLEEPQAAFYAWLHAAGDRWRRKVRVGDVVLVCDVGGGTTDFTLIAVTERAGQLELTRLAVGDHILLGGDNMDRTLAYAVQRKLDAQNVKLDTGQMLALVHACRVAKESLLGDPKAKSAPVTILGRGSKVIGGTIKTELIRDEVESVIVDGFFPATEPDAEPQAAARVGLQELGLPYAADPAITKHLAQFLRRHAGAVESERAKGAGRRKPPSMLHATAILFNGGVFKAAALRRRMVETLQRWAEQDAGRTDPLRELESVDLDRAVARGAAYYGLARRGAGVRIRGGTARSYYVGIATAQPAVPGLPPPLRLLCVVPFGMEEGTEADIPGREFGLVVGAPVDFRFFSSTVRRHDPIGTIIDDWSDEAEELAPLHQALEAHGTESGVIPVHLHSRVTEVGTLELSCRSRDGRRSWKLEFHVREQYREE
jgi:hypothetical protein